MTASIRTRYDTPAKILQALAHPTRLFIVDKLARQERNVSELTRMVGVEMATVSRHLSLLKNSGLLQDEKRGAQVFYRVRAHCVLKILDCVKVIQAEGGRT